jgi:O-antigen/teichoic acid export membrane protein
VTGPATEHAAPDSISRNAAFDLAVRIVSAAFTAALTLYLVRALGTDGYGVFALALGVGTIVGVPSDLGVSQAAARFIAEVRTDAATVAGVLGDALKLKLIVSGLIGVAVIAAAGPIASAYNAPDLAWPLRVMVVALFGQNVLLLFRRSLEALGKVSVYLRVITLESALEAGASIGLVLLGAGAVGAMIGRAAAYTFAAGLGLLILARTIGRRIRTRGPGAGHLRRIARYGGALVVIDGAFTLFSQIDVLLIGAIVSVPAVALFEAPTRLISFLGFVGAAVTAGVAPRLARGPQGPDRDAFEAALRYLIVFQGLFVAPTVVWAEPLTKLTLGPGYGESADVLRALAPYTFMLGFSPLLAISVNYFGEAKRRVPVAIGAVAINFAIDIALLSRIGVVAGAIGTDVAYALYVGAHLLICRKLLGISLKPLATTFVRTTLAALVMAAVLLAFGSSDVSIPLLLGGGVLGTLAYGASLLVTREVTPRDVMSIGRRLHAALPGPAR